MHSGNTEPSGVTKGLINILQKDRKGKIDFFDTKNSPTPEDSQISIDRNREHLKARRARQAFRAFFYSFGIIVLVVIVLIVARPDLFRFLEYHEVYKSFDQLTKLAEIQESTEHQRIEERTPSKRSPQINKYTSQSPIPQRTQSSQPLYTIKPDLDNYSRQTQRFNHIDLSGKVFSWKDSEGKLHFSNTNFPLDNPTLEVKTEINKYSQVTPIQIISGQILVQVTLSNNGKSYQTPMVLDTGCSVTSVPYKILNRIGAKYGRSLKSRIADGSYHWGREAEVDMITVGSKRKYNVKIGGYDVAGSQNYGLLGLDFLKDHKFKIDFKNSFLVWE